ncbi:MAG: CHAT domain-containing protein, partial [Ginsengibacter sp.]
LQNVLELIEQLPQIATLHLISHSRGGLIGDVLARCCNGDESSRGFDVNEINYLKKENRTADLKNNEAIINALSNKKITVGKFIRVACPASGTTLVGDRMDHFFNMTFNLAGLVTGTFLNPVYQSFKSLAASAINCKNDVNTLPGLEAMNPESPFIKVLNSPQSTIRLDSPLVIISGNCKTNFSFKALLIIAARLFFTKHNDLVVNTAAMYRGSQRNNPVYYFFNEAADTDHFHYFKNKDTQAAILSALKIPEFTLIPDFQILQRGAAGLDRNAILNLDGGQVFSNTVTGTRPIAVVLPGIMGSNLSVADKLVWINYLRFLSGGLKKIDIKSDEVEALSLIKTSYEKLVKYLQQSYDVVTIAFDWRLPLNSSAALFKDKIEELLTYRQPIKIIGHSMGGVLVRDFIITQKNTWDKLNQSPGFKLIFLGAPLGGSYRIPFVLMGNDVMIDKISKLDIFHNKKELLNIFSRFPGLLNLLPLTVEKDRDFGESNTWQDLTAAKGESQWPVPLAGDLKDFAAYRNHILQSYEKIDYSNAVYIAGKDKSTPCGYRIEDTAKGKELVYLSTGEGDQSVTWETGIPKKMIETNSVYYVNVSHGALSAEPSLFRGIEEILISGDTSLFSKVRPVVRGTEKVFRTPQPDNYDLSPESLENAILGITPVNVVTQPKRQLHVTVCNGDLRYASYPLLSGHFLNDGITSAESIIDKQLNYALSDRHQLGIYPGEIGSSDYFSTSGNGFKGALIVGLGALSSFTAYQLTQTVQQAVCKYLLYVDKQNEINNQKETLGISALIVGSGYGGLSLENAARSIIQGVQNANDKIAKLKNDAGPEIENLEFIELFEDVAMSCFYSIYKIAAEEEKQLNFEVNKKIVCLAGKRKRIILSGGENWWNRIVVKLKEDTEYKADRSCFVFSASTGAARDLERDLFLSPKIIQQMLDEISTQNQWSKELAKTIFELLIPNDFKEQLKRRSNANWVVDNYTAGYPWELLQDSVSDAKPLCVNAGMIRQLSMKDTDFRINTVAANNVLVVGDPFLDGYISQLQGAEDEANMVANKLKTLEFNLTLSLKEKAPSIIKKLFSQDYKIIHLAGHGAFNEAEPEKSGMVIGKELFLTTAEIKQLSSVPEFVFVNCCFLGKSDGQAEALYKSRYQLAANFGSQLITNGVKAVVVAGWAVDDAAALNFAQQFYNSMFGGDCFGDAVKKARRFCFDNHPGQNTWGAYQCYGDPYYKFDVRQNSKPAKKTYLISEEAVIDLNNLFSEMNMGNISDDIILNKMDTISNAVEVADIRNGAITEKEAFIYSQLLKYDLALAKFDELLQMNEASFYVSTLENFCNTKAKKTVFEFKNGTITSRQATVGINKVLDELKNLLYISPTTERFSLMGSTNKRKAFIAGTLVQKTKALSDAAFDYQYAHKIAGDDCKLYPLTNWYLLEALLVMMSSRAWGTTTGTGKNQYQIPTLKAVTALLAETKQEVINSKQYAHSYEDKIALVTIMLCELLLQPKKVTQQSFDDLLLAYRNIWAQMGSVAKKSAETEQLEIIISILSYATARDISKLHKGLVGVNDALNKMLLNG